MKIDWTALQFSSELMAVSKSFMAYALEKYAPRTAKMFADSLQVLSRTKLANGLPWDKTLLIIVLEDLKKPRHDLVGFRKFHRWAVDRDIKGFDLNTYLTIKITQEQAIFQSLPISTPWASSVWGVGSWLPQRDNQHALTFETHLQALEKTGYPAPPKGPLPFTFQDFSKALIVYLQRTRSLKFSMAAAYNIAVRRLYNPLFERGVSDPTQLTRGDFDRVVGFLRESGYKNLYDAISHLQVIADTIDNLQLTEIAIHFEHDAKPEKRRHDYISLHDPDRAVRQRKSDDRLPSREAMEAHALCSNHPLSEGEEILLRVIDLLIATGQRGNEVAVIPYDCWVERPIKGTAGYALNQIRETGEAKFTVPEVIFDIDHPGTGKSVVLWLTGHFTFYV
jgi:hypothetical protein